MEQLSQEVKASYPLLWNGHSLSSLTQRGAKEEVKERIKEEQREEKKERLRAVGPMGSLLCSLRSLQVPWPSWTLTRPRRWLTWRATLATQWGNSVTWACWQWPRYGR